MKITRKELRRIILEEYRAVVSESMGSGEEELRSVLEEGWFGSYRSPRQKAILVKLNKLIAGEETEDEAEEAAVDKGHDQHMHGGGWHPGEDAYPSWYAEPIEWGWEDGVDPLKVWLKKMGYENEEDDDEEEGDEGWEGKPGERPRSAPEEKIITEEMGVETINQLQFLLQDAGEEEFQYVLDSLDVFREGNTEARIDVRNDKIRVSVFMPDPDDPDDMEWNGSEDFDKTPKGLHQALEYVKKRLFDSDPIWNGIEQVVRRYDQPYKKRQVEYFIQKNYHGETNQYWTVQAGDGDDEGFSVWVIDGGEKFEIRNSWGKTVMETRSPEDVPGMVNKYMQQKF